MERVEFIAEAKKNNFTDSQIQELLELYDECAKEGSPLDFDFYSEGALSKDEVFYTAAEDLQHITQP